MNVTFASWDVFHFSYVKVTADHSSRGVLATVVRRCVWSRNIKNMHSIYIYIYIYDISSLRVNDLITGIETGT
jgi:hypothetical protein